VDSGCFVVEDSFDDVFEASLSDDDLLFVLAVSEEEG